MFEMKHSARQIHFAFVGGMALLKSHVAIDGFAPCQSPMVLLPVSTSKTSFAAIPTHLEEAINLVALSLWGPQELQKVLPVSERQVKDKKNPVLTGEAHWDSNSLDYIQRRQVFKTRALDGDSCAQHSLGLLLWNGYCGAPNEIESARWHAAAAVQHHLDAMAVLGGCLRTGAGVAPNVELGLELIAYTAQQRNPTGINKQAALEEAADNYEKAFALYQSCPHPNALLLMNLGWSYMEGAGTSKDTLKGIDSWKDAVLLAPDEGSEEAAWFLYQHYRRDDPKEAQKWLSIAASLGYTVTLQEK